MRKQQIDDLKLEVDMGLKNEAAIKEVTEGVKRELAESKAQYAAKQQSAQSKVETDRLLGQQLKEMT